MILGFDKRKTPKWWNSETQFHTGNILSSLHHLPSKTNLASKTPTGDREEGDYKITLFPTTSAPLGHQLTQYYMNQTESPES